MQKSTFSSESAAKSQHVSALYGPYISTPFNAIPTAPSFIETASAIAFTTGAKGIFMVLVSALGSRALWI